MITMHACVLALREELRTSSYGVYHLSHIYARKYGLTNDQVLEFFKVKFPELYPLEKI